MKSLKDYKKEVKEFTLKNIGPDSILFDSLFRLKDNKLNLLYFVYEYIDVDKNDYRVKLPSKYILQDIKNGEIKFCNNEKDNIITGSIPVDKVYDNNGDSILFDELNVVIRSYQYWQKKIIKELNTNDNDNYLYNERTMLIDKDLISPKDYVINNIETYLNKMLGILFDDMGGIITDSFNEYGDKLFNDICEDYINNNIINKNALKKYNNFIKYAWPEFIDLINESNNIEGTKDENYDELIEKLLIEKKENKSKKDNNKKDINDLLDRIDKKIEELEKAEKK